MMSYITWFLLLMHHQWSRIYTEMKSIEKTLKLIDSNPAANSKKEKVINDRELTQSVQRLMLMNMWCKNSKASLSLIFDLSNYSLCFQRAIRK